MANIIALFLGSSLAIAQGFTGGTEYQATLYRGSFTMNCIGSGSYVDYCTADKLEPYEFDFFVHDSPGATKTVLTAINEAGEEHTKKFRFNSEKGRSESHVNLWISTLFQRPLLSDGVNVIRYEMSDENKNVVDQGVFEVNVDRLASQSCPHRFYSSFNEYDCRNRRPNLCRRYFNDVIDSCQAQ